MPYLTSTVKAEIDGLTRAESALLYAVLGGEDGVHDHLADEGVLDPSAEDIEGLLDNAEDALAAAEHTARLYPRTYRPVDLDTVRNHIDKLRGALAVAA